MMTRFFSLLLVLAITAAACQSQGEQAGSTEETATTDTAAIEQSIRANADRYAAAAEAADVDAFVSLYTDDAVLMAPGMAKVSGIDAVRTAYEQMYASGPVTDLTLNIDTIFVSQSGDVAYETGTYTMSYPGPDGAAINDAGKYLAVWKPTATGEWKIAVDTWNADASPEMAEGAATEAAPAE